MLTLSDASSFREMDLVNEKDNTGYPTFSLVISGQSLVHALRPDLELLFLGVAEHCNGKFQVWKVFREKNDDFIFVIFF